MCNLVFDRYLYHSDGSSGCPGALPATTHNIVESSTATSDSSSLSAVWAGQAGDIAISVIVHVPSDGTSVTSTVTLQNTGNSTVKDLRYTRYLCARAIHLPAATEISENVSNMWCTDMSAIPNPNAAWTVWLGIADVSAGGAVESEPHVCR